MSYAIQQQMDSLTLSSTIDEITEIAIAAVASQAAYDRSNLFRVLDVVKKGVTGVDVTTAHVADKAVRSIKPRVMGHGPVELIGGDMQAGHFGEVSSEELFRGDDLALELGIDDGELQNEDAGWLKFARHGRIIYIAKRSFMHTVRWSHIYSRGVVYGTDDNGLRPSGTPTNQYTSVEKEGFEYVVGLMTGAASDPVDASLRGETYSSTLGLGAGSEWNELIYRVHQDIPVAPNGLANDGGAQFGENWAEYTDDDFNIRGNGQYKWCQETASDDTSRRVSRGSGRLSIFNHFAASSASAALGWYPRLVHKS